MWLCLFFFNDTATTEIYTLSLHDALPIWHRRRPGGGRCASRRVGRTAHRSSAARRGWETRAAPAASRPGRAPRPAAARSEEHTSELQSRQYLVCRLLLEKKKAKQKCRGKL